MRANAPAWSQRLGLFAAVLLVAAGAYGCSTVRIVDAKGDVAIHRTLGFVKIVIDPHDTLFSADLTSVGFSSTPLGNAVGYAHTSLFATDRKCGAVFIIKTPEQAEHVRELLDGTGRLCYDVQTPRGNLQ